MIEYSFRNDYSEGAHDNILKALIENNTIQETGYGKDNFCDSAINLIREKIKNNNADIHLVAGGTQANLIVISSMLKPFESIIATEIGHINNMEAGAIEATGHKINLTKSNDGKITIDAIKSVLDSHTDEHMVKPKAVYISNPTEIGSIYSKNELEDISKFCKQNNLYLYLDGARLGSALMLKETNLKLPDISSLVDVFYIGGTKNGALFGEAIVILNDELKNNFRFHIKQKGALIAKGRVLGIQFIELFKDNLYFDLAKHANEMANKLATGIKQLDYKFLTNPVSNQIFPIFPNNVISKLSKKYDFAVWNKIDDNFSSVRLVTSWATNEEYVNKFIEDLKSI